MLFGFFITTLVTTDYRVKDLVVIHIIFFEDIVAEVLKLTGGQQLLGKGSLFFASKTGELL